MRRLLYSHFKKLSPSLALLPGYVIFQDPSSIHPSRPILDLAISFHDQESQKSKNENEFIETRRIITLGPGDSSIVIAVQKLYNAQVERVDRMGVDNQSAGSAPKSKEEDEKHHVISYEITNGILPPVPGEQPPFLLLPEVQSIPLLLPAPLSVDHFLPLGTVFSLDGSSLRTFSTSSSYSSISKTTFMGLFTVQMNMENCQVELGNEKSGIEGHIQFARHVIGTNISEQKPINLVVIDIPEEQDALYIANSATPTPDEMNTLFGPHYLLSQLKEQFATDVRLILLSRSSRGSGYQLAIHWKKQLSGAEVIHVDGKVDSEVLLDVINASSSELELLSNGPVVLLDHQGTPIQNKYQFVDVGYPSTCTMENWSKTQ